MLDIEDEIQPAGAAARTVMRNTTFVLAGQLVLKVLALGFNVYMVRYLGGAGLGRYAASIAYVGVFAMLTDFGATTYSVREMARRKSAVPAMVSDIMAMRGGLSLIVITALTLTAPLLRSETLQPAAIFVASLSLLVFAYQGSLNAVFIARERLDLTAAMIILKQLIFIGLGLVWLLRGGDYIGLLMAMNLAVLAMGMATHLLFRRWLGFRLVRPNARRWPSLLRASMPFGINGATRELSQRFDTVLMAFILTDEAVGWYSAPYNLVVMLLVVAQSMGMAVYPTLVKEWRNGEGQIGDTVRRVVRYMLLTALPLTVGGFVLADRIILVLYRDEFLPSVPALRLLLLALPALFMTELVMRIVNSINRETAAARLGVAILALSVTLNLLLIPAFGIIGAAATYLIVRTVHLLGLLVIVGRSLLPAAIAVDLLRILGAAAAMGGAVWLLRTPLQAAAGAGAGGLGVTVGSGALVYILAIFLLGAITREEWRAGVRLARRRLRWLN
jgi:O-antigen/teichoic acid export membrane protein